MWFEISKIAFVYVEINYVFPIHGLDDRTLKRGSENGKSFEDKFIKTDFLKNQIGKIEATQLRNPNLLFVSSFAGQRLNFWCFVKERQWNLRHDENSCFFHVIGKGYLVV